MEKVIIFNAKSALGSFQRPQSNNNPSTFNIIPKSALVGMICAVIGIEREVMKASNMYKILTEKLRYSIIPRTPFQIKYWSEYGYNHGNVFQNASRPVYTPAKYERLVDIDYDIHILYDDNDTDVAALLQNFVENVKAEEYVFPPYMGMANFMTDLSYVGEEQPQACNGEFETKGICTEILVDESQPFENIRTDDIPTRNINYLAYDRSSYKTIYFHDNCGSIKAQGNYYEVGQKALEFI